MSNKHGQNTQSFLLSYYLTAGLLFVQPQAYMNSSRQRRSSCTSLVLVPRRRLHQSHHKLLLTVLLSTGTSLLMETSGLELHSASDSSSSPHGAAPAAQPSTALLGAHILPCLLHHLLHQLKQTQKTWQVAFRTLSRQSISIVTLTDN